MELEGDDGVGTLVGGDGFGGSVLGGGLIVAEVDQGKGVGQGDGHVLPAADLAALLLDLGGGAVLLDFAGDAVGGGGGHFKVGVGLLAVLDGGEGEVASWRNTVTVENVHPNTTVAFRMNNLSGSAAELKLYAYGADGKLAEVGKELWSITDETGAAVDTLSDGTLYELRVSVADGGAFDLSEAEKEIKISVVLAK